MVVDKKDWDMLPCGVYVISRDKRIVAWNSAMSRLTGHTRETVLGKDSSLVRFHEPDEEDNLINPFQCVNPESSPFVSRAIYLKDTDNKLRLGFVQAQLIDDPENPDFYILVVLSDISEEISCEILETSRKEKSPGRFHGIVGRSAEIRETIKLIRLAADSTANVLIQGESGTGKELIAKAIHQISNRKNRPIVSVNCSALPEALLESELFGHVKGAFTGAYRDKTGKFEAANGGTVFLDEIGDISPLIQLKLLRAIQEKAFERVGDNKRIDVDMRIITATNKDLRQLVSQGSFREDLYYRLKVFPILTTPLRDHKSDIPLLCRHFIDEFNRKTGKRIKGLTGNALKLLMDYCWPGNIRELENAMEYAFVLCTESYIDIFDLPQDIRVLTMRDELCNNKVKESPSVRTAPESPTRRRHSRLKISKEELVHMLQTNGWNKAETARQLNISRVALWKKLKKMEIEEQ